MNLSIVSKIILSIVVLVLVSISIVSWLFYDRTTSILVQQAVGNIAKEIHDASSRLQEHIINQREDTLFLTSMLPIQDLLRTLKTEGYDQQDKATYQQSINRLQATFTAMLENKPDYLKIRFIDHSGQERVAVKRLADKLVQLKNDKLQNRAHRPYVSKTRKLSAGSVYLSEINLSRDHGKVSKPYREVLRSASPVFDDSNGEIAGMIVITTDMGRVFRNIQNYAQDENSKIYITNDRGGYLLHPDASKAYGFDLGKRFRIQEDFPQLGEFYLPDNQENEFILLPEVSGRLNMERFIKIPFDPDQPQRFIVVGISELYSTILNKQTGLLNNVLVLTLIITLLVTLLAVTLAFHVSRPIRKITQAMNEYAHGEVIQTAMPVDHQDEIGLLARSFESLIGQANKSRFELEELNLNLEKKVLERTHELEDKNAELERFAYTVSHDLKSPLVTISGFIGLLEKDIADNHKERIVSDCIKISEAADTMQHLLNDLLELSRIGRQTSSRVEVAVESIVSSVLDMLTGNIFDTQAIITVEPDLPVVQVEEARFKEVYLNLIENAIKYRRDHVVPEITIGVKHDQGNNNEVVFFVKDNGIGIDARYQEKIFGLFERLSKDGDGTGIGLAIVKRIIEVHGGRIWVESDGVGHGSTFNFTISKNNLT